MALEQAGTGRAVVDAIVEKARALGIGLHSVVVDLGSGSGEMLGRMSFSLSAGAVGIDLSVAAADFAAHRFPSLTWVVANADRRLPILDQSVDLVLSVFGRRNPAQCARVLKPGGSLIVALPGEDDLIELRMLVQGAGISSDRSDAMIAAHQAAFTVIDRVNIRDTIEMDRGGLLLLLRGTYRGARFAQTPRVDSITRTHVTLSSDLVTLTRVHD